MLRAGDCLCNKGLGHLPSPGSWPGLPRPPRFCPLRALTLGVAGTSPATAADMVRNHRNSLLEHDAIRGNRIALSSHLFCSMILSEKSATFRDHALEIA